MQNYPTLWRTLTEQHQKNSNMKEMESILPKDIRKIHQAFKDAGKKLYVVGGAVRDVEIGGDVKDIDLCTDAMPEDVLNILDSIEGIRVKLKGKAFAVVDAYTDEHPDGYEIATFRKDIGTGRHPEVQIGGVTIEEDCMRRDITMNAMFYDLDSQDTIDLVGGRDDIARRVVRMVGNPYDRIAEDKLRVLRVIRFAARYNFDIDENTMYALLTNSNLDEVSRERMVDEFISGLMQSVAPSVYIHNLRSVPGLIEQIFPGIELLPVNEFCPYSRNATVTVAMLTTHSTQLKKKLVDLNFDKKLAAGVDWLHRFYELDPHSIFDTFTKQDSTDISNDDLHEYVDGAVGINHYKASNAVDAYIRYSKSEKTDGNAL